MIAIQFFFFQTQHNTIAIQFLFTRLNIIQLHYNSYVFKTKFGRVNFRSNLEENLHNQPENTEYREYSFDFGLKIFQKPG